jgi:hypothetical protein
MSGRYAERRFDLCEQVKCAVDAADSIYESARLFDFRRWRDEWTPAVSN